MNLAKVAAISALVVLPVVALAASAPVEGLIDSVLKCSVIGDGDGRLACYDSLIPSFRAAKAGVPPAPAAPPPMAAASPPPVAPPAAAPPAATPPAPPPDNRSWYDPGRMFGTDPQKAQTTPGQFGSDNLPAPPPKPGEAPEELDSITATVTDYAFNPVGKVIVFLDNGQIWKQLPSDDTKIRFSKTGTNVVTIERGMMGSYQLSLNGQTMEMKVKRIK